MYIYSYFHICNSCTETVQAPLSTLCWGQRFPNGCKSKPHPNYNPMEGQHPFEPGICSCSQINQGFDPHQNWPWWVKLPGGSPALKISLSLTYSTRTLRLRAVPGETADQVCKNQKNKRSVQRPKQHTPWASPSGHTLRSKVCDTFPLLDIYI